MELCLVRHAIAVDRMQPGFGDDSQRPLTDEGREKMELGARGLARLWTPELIVSSPYVRARQTAEILQRAANQPPLRYSEALANGDHEDLLEDLRDHGRDRIAVVGHEPWMSELLALVLSGSPSRVSVRFKKGAAALVKFAGSDPRSAEAELLWFMTPAALRRVGKG